MIEGWWMEDEKVEGVCGVKSIIDATSSEVEEEQLLVSQSECDIGGLGSTATEITWPPHRPIKAQNLTQ